MDLYSCPSSVHSKCFMLWGQSSKHFSSPGRNVSFTFKATEKKKSNLRFYYCLQKIIVYSFHHLGMGQLRLPLWKVTHVGAMQLDSDWWLHVAVCHSSNDVQSWSAFVTTGMIKLDAFLGKFAKLYRATITFMSVCPSDCNNSVPTGRISIKLYIRAFFRNLVRKFKFH